MYQSGQLTLVVTTNLVSLWFDKTKVCFAYVTMSHGLGCSWQLEAMQ